MIDRLRHAADVAKFKADQLLRVNRVQSEISNLRREIQTMREAIASAALDLHRSGGLLHAELEQLCVVIDRLNAQIAEREAAIAAIQAELPPQLATATTTYAATAPAIQPAQPAPRPTRVCPHCGFGAPAHAAFCPNCGRPLPKLAAPAEPVAADQTAPARPVQPEEGTATTREFMTPATPDTNDTTKGG
jgi:hypothetical protein